MTSQMWRRLAPAAILLLGLALFLLFGLERYFSFEMLSRHHATLAAWVADNDTLAVVLFVLAYALVVAFSLPVAIIITPLGGFLFGVWMGAILSVIGATLGSVAVFLAARTAFYDLFHARAGAALARFEDGFRRDSFSYLLFLRLVPVFPVLAGQHRAGAARHEARPLHPGDVDRHHSRRRSSMPASARASARCSTAARRRTSASSSNGASCCPCSGSPPWRWCRCSTRTCAAARRRRDMNAVLTPDVCVVGGGSAGLVVAVGRRPARPRRRADRARRDGRRLPQLRLRAVQGPDRRRQGRAGAARRRAPSASRRSSPKSISAVSWITCTR